MPKKRKKQTYMVHGEKYMSFEKAAARAIDLSLQTESQTVAITEYGLTGTFRIEVTATAEEIE